MNKTTLETIERNLRKRAERMHEIRKAATQKANQTKAAKKAAKLAALQAAGIQTQKPKKSPKKKTKPSVKKSTVKTTTAKNTPKKEYKLFTNPPSPVTWESLIKWLSDTGWVEGRVGRIISSLDRPYFDDYVQEVWVQILEVPHEKLLDLFQNKGRFVNYIKSIILNNVRSTSSHLYNNIRKARTIERFLTDEQWQRLDDTGESEYDTTFCINDFDPETRNRSAHYGYDKESCKIIDPDDMIDQPSEIEE